MMRSFQSVNTGDDIALRWNNERNAFVTDDFSEGLKLELRFPELTLQFLEDGEPVKHELHMEGRSPAQVEAWVLVELLHRGINQGRFSKDLPYEIPDAMAGDNVEYSPEFREGEMKKILEWFTAAADLLKKLDRQANTKGDDSTTLTLRTRDFCLEASVPLIGQPVGAQNDRHIRVGFFPLRFGAVDPHYRVSRSEPSTAAPDIFEIIKSPDTTSSAIAGPEISKKIADAVAKLQKLAAQ
jgi:hypothetical protein